MKFLPFCFALLATSVFAADSQVATFVVKSRPAAAMIDAVRPLLGESGGASAFHDKLIIRGSRSQIANVRQLLKQIDQPARRLFIEVRRTSQFTDRRRDVGYGATTGNVRLGDAPRGSGARTHYRELQTQGRDDGTHRVQALDGRPALIRTGASVPVYRAHQQVIGNQVVQGFDVSYRDTHSGFFALPRVHGDQVTVEIYQQHEREAGNGRFNAQQASSVLRGALGQWLTLGNVGGSDSDQQNTFGRHVRTQSSGDRRIELRVIAVD